MSGALDTLAPKAKDLISKFGKDLLYLDIGELDYNPSTGEITAPTETSRGFVGVVANVNTQTGKQQLVEGETYKMGDKMIQMAADGLSWEPEEGRQIALGSSATDERYTILGVDPLYSGNEIAVYNIHVRK